MNNKNYYIDKVVPFRGKFICSFKKTNGLNKIRESLILKNSMAAIIRMGLVLEIVLYGISACVLPALQKGWPKDFHFDNFAFLQTSLTQINH